MEKRFQKIGEINVQLPDGCPLAVHEVSLWRDNKENMLFMIPTMKNEYSAAILKISVGYEVKNEKGSVIEREKGYILDDIGNTEDEFGRDLPITLRSENAVSGQFHIEEITFEDGYIWKNEESEAQEEETPNVTMVKTIGGFGPEGPTFRKIPLSVLIGQRMGTQLIATVIAVVMCVFSLVDNIGILRQEKESLQETLVEGIVEYQEMTEEEAIDFIVENELVKYVRGVMLAMAIMLGSTMLFMLFLTFYLSETRRSLRTAPIVDDKLAVIIRRIKLFSIVQLVLCVLFSFNFFGIFSGISGLSAASLHKKIMRSKHTGKEFPQV
ncbi:MAG: hypothetical protein E7616_08160 [Ruminococcaceae bacterium]|nr:hypothetical protein [Oscillospiraceae bacterium]